MLVIVGRENIKIVEEKIPLFFIIDDSMTVCCILMNLMDFYFGIFST